MELTVENTALVFDSTADYPEGPSSYPNWRVVPLYVRFGEESFRDYVDLGPAQFYERLAAATELPSTSQPSPGDFAAAYEELSGYERVLSLQLSSTLSGTFASATAAAADFPAVRVIDTRTVSAAIAMLGVRGAAAARARHDRRGDRRAGRALPGASTSCCSRSTRSTTSRAAAASAARRRSSAGCST